jgi:ornithine cyclodeaminase
MAVVNISGDDVRAAVPMQAVINGLREGFVRLARGEFEMPVRTVLRDGQFIVMLAMHVPTASTMVKTLSVNLERTPSIVGTVVWTELGQPDTLVADAATVTALRTGAAVGVATDLLAAADAAQLTLFGAGAQAADQVRAVNAVRPLSRVVVLNFDRRRADALIDLLAHELPAAEVVRGSDIRAALSDADIVCCATPSTTPLFDADMLPGRVHVNAIGAYRPTMRELPDELLASSFVVVDDVEAVLEESGEILHAIGGGVMKRTDLVPLSVALTDRPQLPPQTVFKSVGIAMQDWVVAHLLAERFLPTTATEG